MQRPTLLEETEFGERPSDISSDGGEPGVVPGGLTAVGLPIDVFRPLQCLLKCRLRNDQVVAHRQLPDLRSGLWRHPSPPQLPDPWLPPSVRPVGNHMLSPHA